jgi:hypothetical protein
MKIRLPNTAWGWHRYYVNRFNRTATEEAEYLAILNLFFHLAFGDEKVPA